MFASFYRIATHLHLNARSILMCDEATSALDSHTESHIMRSLRAIANNRTSIFIAHRLSTVTDCDIIFVLKNGRILESGNHGEVYL